MVDYFIGELHCPHCGTVNGASANTNMQAHLRSDADGSGLGVGFVFDSVDVDTQHLVDAGYSLVSPPRTPGTLRLLDVWICPACETEQWAAVDIRDRRIERLQAVTLDKSTLESANFISEANADFMAEALSGVPQSEIAAKRLDSVHILRKWLR